MKKYLELFRVKHYIKNILIFIPLFFSKQFLDIEKILSLIVGFIAFCLISSTVYIINDIKDVDKDKKHPIKKNRPIASGKISILNASIIAIINVIVAIIGIVLYYNYFNSNMNLKMAIIYLLVYLFLNILYSFGLKNIPIIDVAILVSGFVIRVLFGGCIVQVEISNWLYLTIMSISFYFALGKRRNEILRYEGKNTRNVLEFYTKDFLDKNMYVCMALAICFYALWAINYVNDLMIWTVPIVMLLAMKYSLNIENAESEGDPVDILLKDKSIILLGIIYIAFIVYILYCKI